MAKALDTGDKAPIFESISTNGEISLADLKGKNVILYFYPKDDTPGCTIEAQDFSKKIAQFKQNNCVILGVSKDSITSHEKFIIKHSLDITLISDPDTDLCKKFGVIKEKSMFGKKYMGIDRSTFLINSAGNIEKVWRSVKVKGHADAVLDEVKKL